MKLGQRIREARSRLGWTQHKLAEQMAVSIQAVSQWENDKTIPTTNRILSLAGILGFDADEFLTDGPPLTSSSVRSHPIRGGYIPIVSRVRAGNWHPAQAFDETHEFVNISWEPSGPTFALEIEGESMLPEFQSGDVVIIDTGLQPLPGDYVVASIENEDEATFKKYRPRGVDEAGSPVIELAPLNPDYPTLVISSKNPGRIVGTMCEHRRFRRRR